MAVVTGRLGPEPTLGNYVDGNAYKTERAPK